MSLGRGESRRTGGEANEDGLPGVAKKYLTYPIITALAPGPRAFRRNACPFRSESI